jgi:endonuclease YncB( thermonuclease family)
MTVGKTLSAVAALGVLLIVLVHGASGGVAATSATQVAVVASVYDGDTLSLRDGRRVRLLQIDTPELGSGECYSRAARTALLGLAPPGRRVVLEADPALDRTDRYARLLRYVKRNGVNVNVELARRGAAAPYFYGGDRGRYAGALMRAAQGAKTAKRGLWKACPSTVLDPFRAVATGRSGPSSQTPPSSGKCDPNYSGLCVPPYPPDLDCADVRAPVRVVGRDPHRLDGDNDGIGCEQSTPPPPPPARCDPNYAGGCVPPYPPDLDCADIRALGIAPVRVIGSDPHRLDGDNDGIGCE